jgi:membrane glycosyltransferase
VLASEAGSFELNPPTVLEFIRRDLRWCQGNLQYLRLLGRPGLRSMGRLQLALAVLMYAAPPALLLYGAIALLRGMVQEPAAGSPPLAAVLSVTATFLAVTMAPKLLGTLAVLLDRDEAARYGGRDRVMATGLLELVFSLVLTPLMLSSQGIFVLAMLAGRRVEWGTQHRAAWRIGWREAARALWPQLAIGFLLPAACAATAPQLLGIGLVIGGWLLAGLPFAVLTARGSSGLVRARIAATPEELDPPMGVVEAGYGAMVAPKGLRRPAPALTSAT